MLSIRQNFFDIPPPLWETFWFPPPPRATRNFLVPPLQFAQPHQSIYEHSLMDCFIIIIILLIKSSILFIYLFTFDLERQHKIIRAFSEGKRDASCEASQNDHVYKI